MSLIHLISNLTQTRYGVNILEQRPPGEVQGESTNVIGIVADLPWGPVDVPTLITSPADLFDLFMPSTFGIDHTINHPAVRAFINKTFPSSIRVVRVNATSNASATLTFDDASAVDSVDVAARYPGLAGSSIQVDFPANVDTPANADMRVRIGTYDVTYPNVVTAALAVTDPGDPYITIAANASIVAVPVAAAAANLVGGLDGTAVAGDYLGAAPGGRGLQEFADQNVDVDVIFGAEVPQTLVAAWNAGLKAFQDANSKGFCVYSTDSAITTPALAITDVASFRTDRAHYPWPRVMTTDTFNATRPLVEVDGNSFAAVAIASVVPEKSPGGSPGSEYLKGIKGLAITGALTADAYKSLNDAGIAPWSNSTAMGGYIIHRGLTTSLVSGKERIFRRRMTDYILVSMAAAAEPYTGELLDIDITKKALGPSTSIQMGLFRQFLQDLMDTKRIRGFEMDEFGSNLPANIDAGQWLIAVAVKLYSAQEELVFLASIGERVVLSTAA